MLTEVRLFSFSKRAPSPVVRLYLPVLKYGLAIYFLKGGIFYGCGIKKGTEIKRRKFGQEHRRSFAPPASSEPAVCNPVTGVRWLPLSRQWFHMLG